jgi:hypothetical protein
MIGFLPQRSVRRPVYSVTGQKLCYLVSGPDGEWVYSVAGRKYAKITAHHKAWIAKIDATQSATSQLMIGVAEIWDAMGEAE